MPYTSTLQIFEAFKAALQTLVPIESELPENPDTGERVWPETGLDRVVLYLGSPEDAIRRQAAMLREGHFESVALLGFTSQQEGQRDGGGHEVINGLPITIIILVQNIGREENPDEDNPDDDAHDELNFRRLCNLHDAVYLELKPHWHPPEQMGVLNYQWLNSFSIGGTADWSGVRLTYLVSRLADDPENFNL